MDTKNRLFVLIFLAVIMSLFTVQAAVEIDNQKLEFDVNYNNFNDEDQTVIRKTIEFTIKNTESSEVTVATSVTGLSSRYNVPSISQVTIPSGESRTVTFSIDVPHLQSSGSKQIGTVVIKNNAGVQYDSRPLTQNTKSMLTINELRVDYDDLDDTSQEDIFDKNDNVFKLEEKVKPGSEITLKFEDIKNLFDKDYDRDESTIDRIVIKLDPSDSDLFEDFDEEYDLDELKAQESQDLTITLTVSEDADPDEYVLEIEIEGEDGKGAKHTFRRDLELEIERSNVDVRITKFEILPSENIEVCETNVVVNVEIKNFGKERQKETALLLFSDTLGIVENTAHIELDRHSNSNNNYKKTFNFNFDKKNIEVGKHRIDVSAFIKLDKQSDLQHKFITVTDCKNEVEQVQISTDDVQENVVEESKVKKVKEKNEKISSSTIVKTVEDPYTSEDVIVSLIVISMILLLATIAIFISILVKEAR